MGSRTIQISNIPSLHTNKQVLVDYLEGITGKGSVCACNLRSAKSRSKVYAIVQFESAEMALKIYDRHRAGTLTFMHATLTVQFMQKDILSRPKSTPACLDGVTLHMGCQISQNAFCVLWSATNVLADFGFDIRRISLYLNEHRIEYKMELLFRDVRYIHLRNGKEKETKHLLLQLHGAPRIYRKEVLGSRSLCLSDVFNDLLRDNQDFQWVRTTDFTGSYCIGKSSSICLELPCAMNICQIRDNFLHYKEIPEKFSLENGSSFSPTLKLVPTINPPRGVQLSYEILFRVNSLVHLGILSWPSLGKEFFSLLQADIGRPPAHINYALSKLGNLKNACYEPVKWLKRELNKYKNSERPPDFAQVSLDDGLMYVRRVLVTPSKVYFFGPEVNVSNRVTRHYAKYIDDFLRVSFVDENFDRIRSSDLSQRMLNRGQETRTEIYKRILSVLREGIVIGHKKFDFLAFSSSQLRENSVWMFASNGTVNADGIRKWMGDIFAIRNVAKCAARMGQSFSSSTETLHVKQEEIEVIPDIDAHSGGRRYIFSDGIGKISQSLAKQVAAKCRCDKKIPSAFQIRYGGYKGVVARDPTSFHKLSLRPSMQKYTSLNTNLDVLSWTRFRPCFLNRQIISLLSTLGVADRNFEMLQEQAVRHLGQILSNREVALEALQIMSGGDNHKALIDMLSCGYFPSTEPYLRMMLLAFKASKLLELRNRARIFVPKGRCLMGCLDETGTLKYGEVFVQVSHTPGNKRFYDPGLDAFGQNGVDHTTTIVLGKVIVAKNPCLHPGDVRILSAVNTSRLHHMVDCVVFPQQGPRPHPDECSGSDLDGDLYFISWDKSLIPPQEDPPMDYVAQPRIELDHQVTIQEIQEYFVNYMINDSLGIIANAHTVYADKEYGMARSPICLELAKLFSTAVDFPKTGIPAQLPGNLHPKEYPDFMEKDDKPMYVSKRILGKLYRSVKELPQTVDIGLFTLQDAERSYDKDLEVFGFDMYVDDALMHKNWYDTKLATLMDHYGVKNEAEIISGNILSLSRFHGNNKKLGDLKETIMLAVKSLRKEARGWFEEASEGSSGSSSMSLQCAKASAWYHVTYHPDYWGYGDYEGLEESKPHFISFPWVIYDKLLHIKRQIRSNGHLYV